jgi:hypothetical protein
MTNRFACAFAFALALCGTSLAHAEDACTIATKGDSPVATACKKGGRGAAQDTMEQMVKTAKAKGKVFKCKQCHEDLDNYKLKASADDDFKKLLASQ